MSEVKLSIDGIQDHVKNIVEANVARALAGGDNVLEQVIGKFCTDEIKHGGTNMSRLQSMIYKCIEAHVRDFVWKMVHDNEEAFQSEVRRQVREKHSQLLKRLATCTIEVADGSFQGEIKLNVKIER